MRKQSRRSLRAQGWAAALLVAALGGCSTVENVMGPIGNVFSNPAPAAGPNANNPTAATTISADENCPGATIRSGAAAWAVTSGPGPTNVRYQASISQIARECALLGDTMTVKVGIEGRLLVGPQGGPGNVNVPIRIALVQEGPQPRPIVSKFYSVPVSVAPGATQVAFTQVDDDLTFPLPADRNIENYIIYVGFDPRGATPPAKAKKKSAPRPKKAAAPKSAPAASPPPSSQPTFQPPSAQPQQRQLPQFEPPPRTQ